MLARLFRGDGACLQQQDAGDNLQAVCNPMFHLPQQHVFLPKQILRAAQQFFLLSFDATTSVMSLKARRMVMAELSS